MILNLNEKQYEIKYTIKRIEMIEGILKKSLYSMLQNGSLTINELRIFFSYGIKVAGHDSFMNPSKAIELFDEVIEKSGMYVEILNSISSAIERDCAFLFPTE